MKTTLISLFIGAIILVTYLNTKEYRAGPIISLSSPQNGETVHDELITVKGNIKNATAVFFNDRKIYLTEAGDFQEKLIVPEGYTIMEVSAEDRFHRTARKRVEIVFTR